MSRMCKQGRHVTYMYTGSSCHVGVHRVVMSRRCKQGRHVK